MRVHCTYLIAEWLIKLQAKKNNALCEITAAFANNVFIDIHGRLPKNKACPKVPRGDQCFVVHGLRPFPN